MVQGLVGYGLIAKFSGSTTFQILRVRPVGTGSDSLQPTIEGAFHPIPVLLFLEPSRNVVMTGLLEGGIKIHDWTSSRSVIIRTIENNLTVRTFCGQARRNVLKHDDQELILGLRSVGNYILCFRPKCIQLFSVPPFPDVDEQPVSEHHPTSGPFHLAYQGIVFGGASLSEPQPNPESPNHSRIIYILAYEMFVGFFYFRATIYNPDYAPSRARARMAVDLVGVYKLDKPQVGIGGGTCVALGAWLGPEGRRGIWIERSFCQRKGSVVAVSFNQSCMVGIPVESGDDLQELCKIAPRIESTGNIFDAWERDCG